MKDYLLLAPLFLATVFAAPRGIHISIAGQKAEKMSISWNTENNTKTSVVKYGKFPGNYTLQASGTSSSYYESYNHHVYIDIEPSVEYYYIVGDEEDGFSDEKTLVSSRQDASIRGNWSFAVFADLGVVNGGPTIEYLNNKKKDFALVWHGGDVSYADDSFLHEGCYLKFCYEDAIDEYLSMIEPVASYIPYMTAPGNHEADCHSPNCLVSKEKKEKLSNFTSYNARYQMPSSESGGVLNMHYSFNYNNVHFISIDSETGYPNAPLETRYVLPCGGFGDQLQWLEADLIKANQERQERPWIFVQGHRPIYQGDSVNKELQAAMEELFYKYKVDVYFAGHVHSYERDYPVYQSNVESKTASCYDNPRATTYLMIGGSGNDEMKNLDRTKDIAEQLTKSKTTGWKDSNTDGPWTALTDKNHVGIGKVSIIDDTTMEFEYIRTSTGEVFDTFTLTRQHS